MAHVVMVVTTDALGLIKVCVQHVLINVELGVNTLVELLVMENALDYAKTLAEKVHQPLMIR